MAKIYLLTRYRLGLRDDVLSRYSKLKEAQVPDEIARNIAAAQASQYGDTKPRSRPGVYRRELDRLLEPGTRRKPREFFPYG